MAQRLTATAKALSKQNTIRPNLIVEIEGLSVIFGAIPITITPRFDSGFTFDQTNPALFFDQVIKDPNQRDVIDLKKSTQNLTQQITIDKGGTSSITTMKIALVNYQKELTELFKEGNNFQDILSRRATVYLNFKNGAHPEDSIRILTGRINDVEVDPAYFYLQVASSENLKRQELFIKYESALTENIDATQTNIPVVGTEAFIESRDVLFSHIKINNELMEVVGINPTSFDVVRSREGTLAAAHELNDSVASFYILRERPIQLALKLMLSDPNNEFEFNDKMRPINFNILNAVTREENSLKFENLDVQKEFNLVEGDIIKITGAAKAANNGTFTIKRFKKFIDGSYIIFNEVGFEDETGTSALVEFKSKYNTLSEGLSMKIDDVAVDELEEIEDLYGIGFVPYNLYIKDTVDNGKDLIDREVFFPSAIYSITRNSRSSAKFSAPPLAIDDTPVLNETTITNLESVKVMRSGDLYRYNTFAYKYDKNPVSDNFRKGQLLISEDSFNRLPLGRRSLIISSNGLRDNVETNDSILRLMKRLSKRYRFAAAHLKNVEVLFSKGFNISVGDSILFGGENVSIPSLSTGDEFTKQEFYEVSNTRLNISSGKMSIDLLATNFATGVNLATFSVSSFIGAGATTTKIPLKLSFDVGKYDIETEKWQRYIDFKSQIRVRSEDYSFDEVVSIDGVDPLNANSIIVNPPLSSAPLEGYIIEPPVYSDINDNTGLDYKIRYTFNMQQVSITSVVDAKNFDVDDASGLFVGQKIAIHSDDYTNDTGDEFFEISNIVANSIELVNALPFTPVINDRIETMSFSDGRDGYVYL